MILGFFKFIGFMIYIFVIMILGFMTIPATLFSLFIVLTGTMDTSSTKNRGLDALVIRIMGTLLLLLSWGLGPLFFAAGPLLGFKDVVTPFSKEAGEQFKAAYLQCFKIWAVTIFDIIFTYIAGHSVIAISALVFAEANRPANFLDRHGVSTSTKLNVSRIYPRAVSILSLVLLMAGLTFVALTFLNVPVYAIRFGFFNPAGGIRQFFQCYGFTFGVLLAVIQGFGITFFGGLFACLLALASLVYVPHQTFSYYCKKDHKAEFHPIVLIMGSLLLWAFTLASWSAGMTEFECFDLADRYHNATAELYQPGAENQTMSWGMVLNITGSYNVTRAPYRPSQSPYPQFSPVMDELGCEIIGAAQYIPFLPFVALLAILWAGGYCAIQLWSKHRAVVEGKAYEMMLWSRS